MCLLSAELLEFHNPPDPVQDAALAQAAKNRPHFERSTVVVVVILVHGVESLGLREFCLAQLLLEDHFGRGLDLGFTGFGNDRLDLGDVASLASFVELRFGHIQSSHSLAEGQPSLAPPRSVQFSSIF